MLVKVKTLWEKTEQNCSKKNRKRKRERERERGREREGEGEREREREARTPETARRLDVKV